MDTFVVVLLIVAVVVVIALLLAMRARARRSEALQERFGPEYERTVEESGDQRAAEKQLQQRQERREKLQIRELQPEVREMYLVEWRTTQTRFVDDPSPAVRDADSLVMNVMRDRGYPVDDFEQRAEDVSVDHPGVVDNYRAAHRISLADEEGQATTEDLRQAMVHYRELFTELLGEPGGAAGDRESGDPRIEGRTTVEHVDLTEERHPRSPR
jgi:FtsZ-interacting cell division protein ZipA